MVDEKKVVKLPHNLILEDRRALSVSGVADIDSFDEQSVILFTDLGELTVKGFNLHINKLNEMCIRDSGKAFPFPVGTGNGGRWGKRVLSVPLSCLPTKDGVGLHYCGKPADDFKP